VKLDPLLLVAVGLVAWFYLRKDEPAAYVGPGGNSGWASGAPPPDWKGSWGYAAPPPASGAPLPESVQATDLSGAASEFRGTVLRPIPRDGKTGIPST
jgi:hypothetical protein